MYIQKKIKELETERDYLQYEIQDIENLQNDEKMKIYSEVQRYEQSLIEESEIGNLEKEIKEREKKISLINKMIRKKAEKYREKLQTKQRKQFESYDRSIEDKVQKINSLQLKEQIRIGTLMDELEEITGKPCKVKLSHLKGGICSMCKFMSIKEAMKTLSQDEYDLQVNVKIGKYEFVSTIKIDDETFNGKKIYECLKRVGLIESRALGSTLKFKEAAIKNVYINIDEKIFNKVYNEEISRGKNCDLSQAISNVVESNNTYYQ